MTNGTSQGLFVVVAIVIFGIFVGMSYVVFGSEGLTNDLENIFTESINKGLKPLTSSKNLIDINTLTSWTNYHTNPSISGNELTLVRTGASNLVALNVNTIPETPKVGHTYTLSGYMLLNGNPVKDSDWGHKAFTTYSDVGTFHVDDKTGYFEITQTWKYSTHMQYILHATIGKNSEIKKGDILQIRNLKLEEGAFAAQR